MRYCLLLIFAITGLGCSQATEPSNPALNLIDKKTVKGSGNIKKSNQNDYIIHIETDLNEEQKQKYLLNYNIKIISKLTKHKYLVKVNPDPGIEEIEKIIKQSKYIKYIQLNNEYKLIK